MGIFEDILGRSRADYQPVDAAFPELTPAVDEAALAEEARQKAAQRLGRQKHPVNPLAAAPDAQSAGVQLEMNNAPAGTGVPFAAQAGMLAPPVTVGDNPAPIPIPRPRPPSADQPLDTDISSQGRAPAPPAAPIQIAPQQPAAAPQQAPEPFGLPSILDKIRTGLGNNSNTLLALGAGLAGAPNIGQGISRAAAAAIPARAADIKQSLEAQYRTYGVKALVDAGVPVQQAIAAQGDPELKKALVQNHIVDRKHELKTVKDWMGNEWLVDFDPFTSKAKPVTFDSAGGANGGDTPGIASSGIMAAARMEPNYDPTTHRDEGFLDAVRKADPLTASAVQDVAEGKMPATGRNLQKLMPLVSRYENGFEANRYSARQNLEKSYYGGGEGAKQLRSANTVIDHGIDLKKAIDDLHNYSVLPGFLNKATGIMSENMGDKKYQDALARFRSNSTIYMKELENALTGKVTVSGQKELHDMFNEYAAPTSNHSALQQTLGMLEKRVNEHENTYRTGMNKPNHSFDADMLTNRPKLDRLLSGDTGSGLKQTQPAPAFKPGKAYKMLPDGSLVEK